MYEESLKTYKKMFLFDWDLKDIMHGRHAPSKYLSHPPLQGDSFGASRRSALRAMGPIWFATKTFPNSVDYGYFGFKTKHMINFLFSWYRRGFDSRSLLVLHQHDLLPIWPTIQTRGHPIWRMGDLALWEAQYLQFWYSKRLNKLNWLKFNGLNWHKYTELNMLLVLIQWSN